MTRTKADIDRLMAEFQLDLVQLTDLADMNERALSRIRQGATDRLDYAALGFTIHNIYCLMENAFLRLAKFFENGLDPSSWHYELLNRMQLDIPGIRPALLTRAEFVTIDEFRAFRHVFRNLYSRPLDEKRIMLLQEKVPTIIEIFRDAISRYKSFLEKLNDSLEA